LTGNYLFHQTNSALARANSLFRAKDSLFQLSGMEAQAIGATVELMSRRANF